MMAEAWKPLIGRPCWGVYNGYSSWLTFQFGEPRLEIREPDPESNIPSLRTRSVHVLGEHQLRVDMAQWLIFQDGARLAHNESERGLIQFAAARLDGQALLEARTRPDPPVTELTFDLGGRVWISRYPAWDPSHALWDLRSGETILSLHADGRLTCERPEGERRVETDYGCVGR